MEKQIYAVPLCPIHVTSGYDPVELTVKGIFHQKLHFCHYLLTLTLYFFCRTQNIFFVHKM